MIGVPVLTGLALGAGAFRSRRDPLAMLMTMIVSAALFLTTPYVGYLDNITVLFLLGADVPVPPRRANVVGSANRVVPDRDRGRVHASHDRA